MENIKHVFAMPKQNNRIKLKMKYTQSFYSGNDKSPLRVTKGDFISLSRCALFMDWEILYCKNINDPNSVFIKI